MKTVYNRTKIVATLGPASSSKETLLSMIKAGVDVCRLNFFTWAPSRSPDSNKYNQGD